MRRLTLTVLLAAACILALVIASGRLLSDGVEAKVQSSVQTTLTEVTLDD